MIAIAISTFNRPNEYNTTLGRIIMHTPSDIPIITVDGGSDEVYATDAHMMSKGSSIAQVKNRCLHELLKLGATEMFLFDDDCYPIRDDWYLPYINSPYPHLCYSFTSSNPYSSGTHKVHSLGNGCMLYIRKEVVDKIGGFDTELVNKYEHTQFSCRAYANGFIPSPFIDVANSDKLLYSMDQHNSVNRSHSEKERSAYMKAGAKHFDQTKYSKNYFKINFE